MKIIFRPICWVLDLYYTIRSGWFFRGVWMSAGHEWNEGLREGNKETLECIRCGAKSIGYYK